MKLFKLLIFLVQIVIKVVIRKSSAIKIHKFAHESSFNKSLRIIEVLAISGKKAFGYDSYVVQ